jgi:UDP:flavonoid glycosyltransferase YjiC (YdhE family)
MATYLFAWELGYGLGHLVNLQPLVSGLSARGHRVELVLRDLAKARALFAGHDVACWQAPFKQQRTKHLGPTLSFSHILFENGFCDAVELETLGEAWRNIFRAVDPDVIVFDHSPTALLAARGLRVKRVTLGTGFFLPLDEEPMSCLQPWLHADPARLLAEEHQVLSAANAALRCWGEPPLPRLAALFHPSDEHLLVTFPELDHYGARPEATYWGAWPGGFGQPPRWPNVSGKKVYAYLKPFPQLAALLEVLRRSGQPTIVYGNEIPNELRRKYECQSLKFETDPLDMEAVGRECDLAILNANHGTAVSILRAGKPSLQIPIFVEQSMLAMALVRQGAALAAPPDRAADIEQQFRKLLTDPTCTPGVQRFAQRYASFDPQQQIAGILDCLEALAT